MGQIANLPWQVGDLPHGAWHAYSGHGGFALHPRT